MGLIDHDQIPARVDQIVEALAVVAGYLLRAPATAGLHRLDGIEGADHLVVPLPEVLFWANAQQLPPGGEVAGLHEVEGLVEVGVELTDPLADQTSRGDHQKALGQAANLELANDQASLNGFAEPHLVGQQVADTVSRHSPLQRLELVRQGDDRTF